MRLSSRRSGEPPADESDPGVRDGIAMDESAELSGSSAVPAGLTESGNCALAESGNCALAAGMQSRPAMRNGEPRDISEEDKRLFGK